MTFPNRSNSDPSTLSTPIPHDLKIAIEFMRSTLGAKISMANLAEHCNVAERTLNEHFRTFLGISPMRYFRGLRLSAARKLLLSGMPGLSVTEVAERFAFNHFGRFAEQYRCRFDEPPLATLRRNRENSRLQSAVKGSSNARIRENRGQKFGLQIISQEMPSIAIVPCQVSRNEPSLHSVAESLADATAIAFGSINALAVMVPRSYYVGSSNPYRIAKELGARYLLTGKIVLTDELRIVLRIVDLASGRHIWGDSFDGNHDQHLELEARAVEGIVRNVMFRIQGAEIDRARRTPPQDLDAYELTMRALPLAFASRPDSARHALDLLYRATEMDSDYGLAPALAGWCHSQQVLFNDTLVPAEDESLSRQLTQRAAILDNDDPLILVARCAVHMMLDEFDISEKLAVRALALNPYSGWAWARNGWLHAYRGESEKAISHFNHALSLDLSSASRANCFAGIGSAHFEAGRYDAAVSWLRTAMLEQASTWWFNRSLSVSHLRLGNRKEALDSFNILRRSCPNVTVSQVVAAVPYKPDLLDRLGDGLTDLGLPP